MKIYSKSFCPYCIRLLSLLDEKGIAYEVIDVTTPEASGIMFQKSGQRGVPEVEIANVIIPDYKTEESLVHDIETILAEKSVTPELASRLTSTLVFL